jgi:hypothetical protein
MTLALNHRKTGIVAMVALGSFLCCGATAPDGCQQSSPPPESHVPAEIAGVAAGIAVVTVVLIGTHHDRHNIKGCVFNGPNGIEVQTSEGKNYSLEGITPNIKVGDLVQLYGSKIRKAKDSKADQVFMIEKLNRDRGPCHITPTTSPAAATPSSPM